MNQLVILAPRSRCVSFDGSPFVVGGLKGPAGIVNDGDGNTCALPAGLDDRIANMTLKHVHEIEPKEIDQHVGELARGSGIGQPP